MTSELSGVHASAYERPHMVLMCAQYSHSPIFCVYLSWCENLVENSGNPLLANNRTVFALIIFQAENKMWCGSGNDNRSKKMNELFWNPGYFSKVQNEHLNRNVNRLLKHSRFVNCVCHDCTSVNNEKKKLFLSRLFSFHFCGNNTNWWIDMGHNNDQYSAYVNENRKKMWYSSLFSPSLFVRRMC